MLITLGVINVSAEEAAPVAEKEKKQERPILYPFDVTIGGQKAVMLEGNMLFAVVDKPVKPNALLELEEVADMLIVNAFKVKADGAVMEPGAQPAIYFVKKAKQVKLDQTMDKKLLEPGRYLVNVVAHGKTSRVVFVVEDASGKLAIPSVKQVFDFLTK